MVAVKLKQISAKSVIDLKPTINHDVAFEIELIDPNQKPLRCKFRPLHNLKEKVQIEAKIIRPSRSQCYKKELLAVVMSIEYFYQYLYGKFFRVYVDHQPQTWILHKTNTHPRLERWLLRLSHYNFEIIYKAGKDVIVADMLSRLPDENES